MGQSRMDNPGILATCALNTQDLDVNKKNKTKQSIFQKAKKISNTVTTKKKPGMNLDAREE